MGKEVDMVLNLDAPIIFNGLTVLVAAMALWKASKAGKSKELDDKLKLKVDTIQLESIVDKMKVCKDDMVTLKKDVEDDLEVIRKDMGNKVGKDVVEVIRNQFEKMNESLIKVVSEGNVNILAAVEQQGKRIDKIDDRLNKAG